MSYVLVDETEARRILGISLEALYERGPSLLDDRGIRAMVGGKYRRAVLKRIATAARERTSNALGRSFARLAWLRVPSASQNDVLGYLAARRAFDHSSRVARWACDVYQGLVHDDGRPTGIPELDALAAQLASEHRRAVRKVYGRSIAWDLVDSHLLDDDAK